MLGVRLSCEGAEGRHVLVGAVPGVAGVAVGGSLGFANLALSCGLGLADLALGGGLGLGVGLFLLQGAQGVLEDDFRVFFGVHGRVAGGWVGARVLQLLLGCGGLGVVDAADDLVAHAGADGEGRLHADDALDGVADGGRGDVRGDVHEAGHGVHQVGDVVGGVLDAAVAALTPNQQAIALLEAVDPARGELGGALVLVARQLDEDVLGLLGELLVGGVAAAVDHLLVPEQDELLDVGPVAEAEARAGQVGVAVEAGVLGGQRVRDGRLRDGLVVLGMEPVDARLVARPHGLRAGPAPQGAPLVEGQRVPLLGGGGPGVDRLGRHLGRHGAGDGRRRVMHQLRYRLFVDAIPLGGRIAPDWDSRGLGFSEEFEVIGYVGRTDW